MEDHLIIGAGITGLTCAAALRDAGKNPVVLEKSRGLGGRISTRRAGELRFDHGAQFARAKSPAFASYLAAAQSSGAVASWDAEGRPAYVGTPKMRSLVEPLAKGVDVRLETEVRAVAAIDGGWRVQGDAIDLSTRHLILAIPAPQAQRLLSPSLPQLEQVVMAPCWALMLSGDRMAKLPDQQRFDSGPIAWICRQASRPDRAGPQDTWVIHAAPDWSREHLEASPEDAEDMLLGHLSTLLGRPAQPNTLKAHRWRFALTEVPLGQPCLTDTSGTLLVGGDWALGARVEAGFESGSAMARLLLA